MKFRIVDTFVPQAFPMRGFTLALDFKIEPGLFAFLDELDRIVLDHGGRIYLAKDVRMDKTVFHNTYPGLKSFLHIRDRLGLKLHLASLQSKRLKI